MIALIEVLLTFVGVMLVLALAAQSLQEVIKIMLAIKGYTRVTALRGLIVEAAVAAGQAEDVGRGIYDTVIKRLNALGQDGVRRGKLRLDRLRPSELEGLITSAPVADIGPLNALECGEAEECKKKIAEKAKTWFPLAMDPVADRYKRRMRGFSLLSAGIVVFGLNADAIHIFQQARTDPEFRSTVISAVATLDSLDRVAKEMQEAPASAAESQESAAAGEAADTSDQTADTVVQPRDTASQSTDTISQPGAGTEAPAEAEVDSVEAVRDSIQAMALRFARAEEGFLKGSLGDRRPRDFGWWAGILISTLLVSLGAPFWHDVLGSLFGLKNRINAQAERARAESAAAEEKASTAEGEGA